MEEKKNEPIFESDVIRGIERVNWLIENEKSDLTELKKQRDELQNFHENFYTKDNDESPTPAEKLLRRLDLIDIDKKYDKYFKNNDEKNKKSIND